MVLLSTAYFAPIQYFVKCIENDTIYIEQYENYIKQTYRNRCVVLGANGLITLSVPIEKIHNKKTLIKDLKISYDYNWQKLHFKSIESSYRSAPFYEFYIDNILPFFKKKYKYLITLNTEITAILFSSLDINSNILFSDKYNAEVNYPDFRYSILPKGNYLKDTDFKSIPYSQVFNDRYSFKQNLSILDLLFNKGPESNELLTESIS